MRKFDVDPPTGQSVYYSRSGRTYANLMLRVGNEMKVAKVANPGKVEIWQLACHVSGNVSSRGSKGLKFDC
jgi:hypothetical protein